jgi:hypothetical protein
MTRHCPLPFVQKFLLFALLLFVFTTPPLASGQGYTLQSDTLIRFFERDINGSSKLVIPVYEYLRLDYNLNPSKTLSFHTYGWGRGDLSNSDYYEKFYNSNATDGELLYGYLEYQTARKRSTFRLGRQSVYTGVGTETIDGLRFSSNLGNLFSISLHGGQPVGYAETSGRSGDLAIGGRLGHHKEKYDIGISYQLIRDDSVTVEDLLATDLYFALPAGMSFNGYISLNLDTNALGEQNYALNFNLLDTSFKTFLENFSYDDYFSDAIAAPQPFLTLASSGESLTRYGINAIHSLNSDWELGGKLTGYSYDINNEKSFYAAALLNWKGDGLQQIGGEIGYLDAKNINDDELLLRLYVYWDQLPKATMLSFISGDIVYASYGQSLFGETSSFFTSLGGGKRFLEDRLQLKFSADYSSDPFFDSDLRGMLSLTYRYSN